MGSLEPALAQAPQADPGVRQAEVRQLNADLQSATDRAALLPILERRQAALIEMLRADPAGVRLVMLDAAESQRILAAAPEAAALLESEGSWDGELERLVQDDFAAGTSVTRFYLRMPAGERIEVLNDPGFPPALNFCPQPMRVSGLRVGPVLRASSAAPTTEPAAVCTPLGEQKVAAFLLSYPSTPLNADWTVPNANSVVFGASNSIAGYVAEVSHNKAFLTGQVFGPYTVDTNFQCFESPANIAAAVIRVVGTSIDFRAFQRLVFIVPTAPDCAGGSRGISTVGCWTVTLADGGSTLLSLAQSSNSPGVPYNSTSSRLVLTHEFGHSLGLGHASSLAFSGTPLGSLADAGVADEYGDGFSVMGNIGIGHFGAPHQDLLEWLDPGGVATIATAGTYQVRPLESAANETPKVLKIQRPGTARFLWIEYRQPIGVDAALSSWSPTVFGGVVVHYQEPPGQEGLRKTHLLDYHPFTALDFRDSPLRAGESWFDQSSPLSLTIGSAGASGIDVTVGFGAPCSYTLGPGSGTSVPAAGGSGFVTVTTASGCAWSSISNSSWLAITSGFSGSGSGSVGFLAAMNSGPQRSGIITIAGQSYTVTQAAGLPSCSYSIGPGSEATMPGSGGTGAIDVFTSSGCFWTATSFSGWLTITSGTEGSGPGMVRFTAAPNVGPTRNGLIVVAGQTYTVIQSAGTCSYTLSPGSSAAVPAAGGSGSVMVTAPLGCAWTATSDSAWLMVTAGFSGSGSGIVQYSALPNSGTQRAGIITIAGQLYTVTQAPGTVISTAPNSLSLSQLAGGTGWHATLFLTNLSNTAEGFTLRFYDDNGLPKLMPIATLGFVDTITDTLAPGETRRYETAADPVLHVAWALLTPATAGAYRLSGFAVFRHTIPSGDFTVSSEAVVDMLSVNESKYVLLYDNLAGPVTTAALANPDMLNPVTILADIRDEQGNLLATDSITLPPLGHTAFVLTDRFPATANRRGSIRLAATPRGFTGLGLRFNIFGTFTSFRFLTSADIQ